jgi:hypothetical protein
VILGTLTDVGIGTLAVAMLVCVPVYALVLWIGRKALMLSVLRELIKRAPSAETREVAGDA